MGVSCPICEHPNRYDIEQAMLHLSQTCTLEAIADLYEVSVDELKTHAVFHTHVDTDTGEVESIAKQVKVSEANAISEVIKEYTITLKNVGKRINNLAFSNSDDIKFEKLLSKPMVDLYLGLGSEIRQSVKALAEVNQILNGPQTDSTSGLAALAAAVMASKMTDG